jgi:hypothetical protein
VRASQLLVLAGMAGACDGQRSPHRAPGAEAGSAATSSSAPSVAPPLLPDGCWAGLAIDQATPELFTSVVGRCLNGFEPLPGARADVGLVAGKAHELAFSVDRVRCLRLVAAGDPGLADLELSLSTANGTALGADALATRFALVSARGPVCVHPGAYRAVLRTARGAGRAILAVYVAK